MVQYLQYCYFKYVRSKMINPRIEISDLEAEG